MQISTRLLIVFVLAAAISPLSTRGADTDAQLKAREALRQKMGELDTQTPVTNATPPAAPSKAPKTKSTPPPKSKPALPPEPAPVVTQPRPTPSETVRTAPPSTRPTPPAQTLAPTPTPQPETVPAVKATKQSAPPPVARIAPASGQATASRPDSERIAKAREAMEAKMREMETQGGQPEVATQPVMPAPPTRAPETAAHQPTTSADTSETLPTPPPRHRPAEAESQPQKSKKPKTPQPQPENLPSYALPAAPPAPVSAEKVAKLNTLLQQYQADRITPEQYHQERAKILAGP